MRNWFANFEFKITDHNNINVYIYIIPRIMGYELDPCQYW